MPSPLGEGGPAGPDEGRVYHYHPLMGCNGKVGPHQSAGGAADSFPHGGSLYFFKNSSIIFSPTSPDFSGWNWQPRTLPWLAAAQISRPP